MKKSNYIAGQWVEGTSSIKNINPSDTSEIIDEYTTCTDEQFEQSIRSAAIAQKEWETVGIEKKSQILINIGDELIQKSQQIGELLSREEGKPLNEGIGEDQELVNNFSITGQSVYVYMVRKFPQLDQVFKLKYQESLLV